MKNDQVEKIITEVDNNELPGLIALDEYVVETDAVNVPGRDRTVPVSNGVIKIPSVGATYKINRNTVTYQILSDWFYKNEVKDMTIIKTDGAGNEFSRELWPNVQLSKFNGPAYDASAPVPAQVMVTFLPEDIIPQAAE